MPNKKIVVARKNSTGTSPVSPSDFDEDNIGKTIYICILNNIPNLNLFFKKNIKGKNKNATL